MAFAALVCASLGACNDGTVRVAYHPSEGATQRYVIDVRSATTTTLPGTPDRRARDSVELRTEHEVLEVDGEASRVRVAVSPEGAPTTTFVVGFDRGAQLSVVERVEGLPAAVLGDVALSDLFPAAAVAPPDRPLEPGDRWEIDERVTLPGQDPTLVRGHGRLARLGVVAGRDVAVIESTYSFPVRREIVADSGSGATEIVGTQTTTVTATHALADGTVQESTATTSGSYRLIVRPPSGFDAAPVEGTLTVEVRSETRRAD